jgi:hypothetical protein
MAQLRDPATPWIGQVGLLRQWYEPYLERLYDHQTARVGDLEKLEQISAGYATRERFLTKLMLDPPEGHRRRSRDTATRRRIPHFIDHPFRQGTGMGRGLHSKRRGWLHTVRHGGG